MPQEEELSHQKSLEIIRQMIDRAKTNFTDNGIGWLLWGSMIFLASVSTYILILYKYENLFVAWNIFGIIAVLLLVYDFTKKKTTIVRTYVDDVLRWVDIGFAVCLFIIILSINISVGPNDGFGFFLMLYGFLMIVQGGALHFKPLIMGAVVNWVGALGIFINQDFKYDMLITAAAVFIGYIIPGLLLRAKYNKK